MNGFKCILALLHLERLVNGDTFKNLTNAICKTLLIYLGAHMREINSKLICFGSHGVVVFTSVHNGVITQICKKAILFM
jgi:hypothetical protein